MSNPLPLCEPDEIVEIGESKFGKRKYQRRKHVEGFWVFEGYQRSNGRVFMIPVEHRNQDSLLHFIKEWILPGTTIIFDFWRISS